MDPAIAALFLAVCLSISVGIHVVALLLVADTASLAIQRLAILRIVLLSHRHSRRSGEATSPRADAHGNHRLTNPATAVFSIAYSRVINSVEDKTLHWVSETSPTASQMAFARFCFNLIIAAANGLQRSVPPQIRQYTTNAVNSGAKRGS